MSEPKESGYYWWESKRGEGFINAQIIELVWHKFDQLPPEDNLRLVAFMDGKDMWGLDDLMQAGRFMHQDLLSPHAFVSPAMTRLAGETLSGQGPRDTEQ